MFIYIIILKNLMFINYEKTNLIKYGNNWKVNKPKGIYKFRIILNSNINNLHELFYFSGIISIDLSNFNSSNVTDMSGMFSYCPKLKEIKGLNKINTSNVKDMSSMFSYCQILKEIKGLNKIDMSNVKSMNSMFY